MSGFRSFAEEREERERYRGERDREYAERAQPEPHPDACRACGGTGYEADIPFGGSSTVCAACGGTGRRRKIKRGKKMNARERRRARRGVQ